MVGPFEKQRLVWSIKNLTRNSLNSHAAYETQYYGGNRRYHNVTKCVRSDSFEIGLGDNNTKWCFEFCPTKTVANFEFCAIIEKSDDDNFTFSLNAAVRTSDHKILPLDNVENGEKFIIEGILDDKNKYLLNDTLTLIIDLKLRRQDPLEELPQNPVAVAVATSFGSRKFSDITLMCSDKKEFPAHRFILDSRSSVFKTLLAADMLEKKTARVVIDDIDGDTMREVLRFIYTNTVENLSELATKLIYAAEKYDLQDLKSMCAIELMSQVTSDTVFELLVLADRFNEETLLEECMDFIDLYFKELRASEHFKKIGIDLVVKCVEYSRKISNSIISLTSSL